MFLQINRSLCAFINFKFELFIFAGAMLLLTLHRWQEQGQSQFLSLFIFFFMVSNFNLTCSLDAYQFVSPTSSPET